MDKLISGLGPAFAAGFAIQQLLEMLDGIVSWLVGGGTEPGRYERHKKLILSVLAIVAGVGVAYWIDLRMLGALGLAGAAGAADNVVSGLFISGGTAGFNSILKFLNYAKEEKKGSAAQAQASATHALPEGTEALDRVAST